MSEIATEKTVHTLFEREKPAKGAVHANNNMNGRAFIWPLFLVAVFGFMVYSWLNRALTPPAAPSKTVVLALRSSPTALAVTLPALKFSGTTVFNTPAPTIAIIPTRTLIPSPLPSLTPIPDVLLSIRTFWPKSWGRAKTASGMLPSTVYGWGAACPDEFDFGTRIVLYPTGRELTCVDRAALSCSGSICNVIVYTEEQLVTSSQAYITNPYKRLGGK